jgi:hypothetical protein
MSPSPLMVSVPLFIFHVSGPAVPPCAKALAMLNSKNAVNNNIFFFIII